jgi:hypothetical protein
VGYVTDARGDFLEFELEIDIYRALGSHFLAITARHNVRPLHVLGFSLTVQDVSSKFWAHPNHRHSVRRGE